jgi:CRP-like cAMP-binding protein
MLKEPIIFKILTHSPIFKGLNESDIETLLHRTGYETKEYRKGDLIVSMGDPCRRLLIPLQGSVKGEMVDYSGKTIKIEDIPAPRPLAVAFLFGTQAVYPVNVVATEPTTIMVIERKGVISLMQKDRDILNNLLSLICNKAQFLTKKLEFLSFKTIREKLAHFLLANSKNDHDVVCFEKSQEEMAEFFGVARQSFARVLKEFQDLGLIRFKRREIRIMERKKLVEVIQN